MGRIIFYMLGAVMMFVFSGCASKAWLVQPEFNPASVKRIGVVVPVATVKMIGVGAYVSVDQDLSTTARAALEKGTLDALKEGGFEVFLLTNNDDVVSFQKGYSQLTGELPKHFPNNGVPTNLSKIEGFDQIRKNSKLDCVVAVEGLDHKSTPGRKAMLVGLALIGGIGEHGSTTISYNVFCGEEGKPMFSEMSTNSSNITDPSNVSKIVGKFVEHMKAVPLLCSLD